MCVNDNHQRLITVDIQDPTGMRDKEPNPLSVQREEWSVMDR